MTSAIGSGVRIGHVHLRVADLERAIRFYNGVLGFEVTMRYGTAAAFLSAGGYHHHIGLNTGRASAASLPHQALRGCTTSPFCTLRGASWPAR